MQKTAFITGIGGQDGAYLVRFLLEQNYHVHGLLRWDSHIDENTQTGRLSELGINPNNITLHYGDITDAGCVARLIAQIRPDEIYNLAALSFVPVSYSAPHATMNANTGGIINIIDALKALDLAKTCRVYQASSSEIFGNQDQAPLTENSPMTPASPYGIAKLAAYHHARLARENDGLHISNGILFNHESALRGAEFVTQKIIRCVLNYKLKNQKFALGNIDASRDWGHADDYIRGMWLMLQQEHGGDYILATGQSTSIRDFTTAAFAAAGITIQWQGNGIDEHATDIANHQTIVTIDPALYRPQDINHLMGDASKARNILGWEPATSLNDLIRGMLSAEQNRMTEKCADAINTEKSA